MRSVTVSYLTDHTYTMRLDNGRHEILSDEDESAGGEDLGMAPYELLLGSIGSCTAITLLMYARRKEWPLEDVSVRMTHNKVNITDYPDATEEDIARFGPNARLDVIDTAVEVKGDLDEAQVARLLEIANRCPVHRTVESGAKFTSSISRLT